jgi:hypothetical protein
MEVLERLGGVASWSALTRHCGPAEIRRLVRSGDLVVDARGHYALPQADASLRAAARLSAVLSHRSAAQFHGWAQKSPPTLPELTFPKNRHLTLVQRRGVVIHRAPLESSDIDGPATSARRTLPEDEALAIADSVLRSHAETSPSLRAFVSTLQGPGSRQARRVAAAANGLSTNPFETELRRLATTRRPRCAASGPAVRRALPGQAGPCRRRQEDHPRGGLIRVARFPAGPRTRRPSLQPIRRGWLAGSALHVGGRHVRR